MTLNNRFHTWYDTLYEPWRLMLMVTVAVPFVLLAAWGDVSIWSFVGLGGMIFLLVSRMRYLLK